MHQHDKEVLLSAVMYIKWQINFAPWLTASQSRLKHNLLTKGIARACLSLWFFSNQNK